MESKSEAAVENELINILTSGHNQWTFRPDLNSEDDLWVNLRQKIVQNNLSEIGEHPLTDSEFERVRQQLLQRTTTPFNAGKWLKGAGGVASITIDRDDVKLGTMSLVLYSNLAIGGGISSYEVVHQIAKQGNDEAARDRRFDVTLLINGLPIVQIELKQVRAKDGIYQAFNQIKKYNEEGMFSGNIFSTLQLFVISNEQTTRYFANAKPSQMDHKYLFSWRTKDNIKVDNLYEFAKQMLNIPDAHRLIANYTIVSEDQDNKALMVLHPYQIHAIEALFDAAKKHQSGYVWHATGSGKTLTAFVATKLLAKKPGVDRTIMMVDRKDLDNQTTSEFTKFASEYNTGITSGKGRPNDLVVGTDSASKLAETLLSDANSNVIIVTTRQKLDAALKYARKHEERSGKNRFKKLISQHIVFVVDECHRALSPENMEDIKGWFPNSTWFGFTGTPIFEVNKRQAQGQLARTTHDQYGDVLHTYTIKNALDDKAVLGFQVEHEDTLDHNKLANHIYHEIRFQPKYASMTDEQVASAVEAMPAVEQEKHIDNAVFEKNEHIQTVIHKIFAPNNAYVKFDFHNGRPQKNAMLTTSSIAMAKRYYHAIKEMTADPDWMQREFPDRPLTAGRTIEDPDFPRIAITYSLDENPTEASKSQEDMKAIIADYNQFYETNWKIDELERYNGDINNRLARKLAAFKTPGKQVDLVIVVDRLLTGFDAPQLQTLFVDRTLEYAKLIQAFSRTNRTFPNKKKGLIVTYRKPATMKANVDAATRLYSESQEETNLIYPDYAEAQSKFQKAYKTFDNILKSKPDLDEHSDQFDKVEYVKAFQALDNAYAAIVTYDEYNYQIENTPESQLFPNLVQEQEGIYNTVKGSLIVDPGPIAEVGDITFFEHNGVNNYDIDSAYIDRLLGDYAANNQDTRDQIEEAMKKLNKSEAVRAIYRMILDAIDENEIDADEDVFVLKRRYFDTAVDDVIDQFSQTWCIPVGDLHSSVIQYYSSDQEVPGLSDLNQHMDTKQYKAQHPDANLFKVRFDMKSAWKKELDDVVMPYRDELR